jgi:nitronate monooxygenase
MRVRWRTPICELLGIEVPIVQAPVSSAPALAAAVSNAGALGMLRLSWLGLEEARAVIRETRRLTACPFGVNLVLEWSQRDRLELALEEGVSAVSLFWGDPSPYLDQIREGRARSLVTASSAMEARQAVEMGAEVIVAQGFESGGHVGGVVSTLPLVPVVVDAVSPVPVIAAGGIADGRGLAAALALGAAGVWLGTRFVASEEAGLHPAYKARIAAAVETDTVYSSVFDVGWPNAPHRTLQNSTIQMWQEAGSPASGARPGEGEAVATSADGARIVRYSVDDPRPDMSGDIEALALYAGQSAGLVHDILPAGDIVRIIADEAEDVLRHLTGNRVEE